MVVAAADTKTRVLESRYKENLASVSVNSKQRTTKSERCRTISIQTKWDPFIEKENKNRCQ